MRKPKTWTLWVIPLLLTYSVFANDRLTPAQRAQIADPANPQFAPIVQAEPPKDQTRYGDPEPLDEATKAWALKRAYQLNGNSMVGPTIDLSNETPFANSVKTEKVTPTAAAPPPVAAEQPDLNMDDLRKFSRRANYKTDICARHGMRRVDIHGGKSWRCK